MIRIFAYLIVYSFAVGEWYSTAQAKTLMIAADEWCPINCAPDAPQRGIGIDLAHAVFDPLGYDVRYVNMSWARALEAVRMGTVDAVVGASKADDPKLIFPQEPIYEIADVFYTLAGNEIAYHGIDSLLGKHIGIIRNYGYSPAVTQLILKNRKMPGGIQEVGGRHAVEQNIHKLLLGRIDVLIESKVVMSYMLQNLELTDRILPLGSIPQGHIYLAFSPALTESHRQATLYDMGIARLRATGEIQKLYEAYGISP